MRFKILALFFCIVTYCNNSYSSENYYSGDKRFYIQCDKNNCISKAFIKGKYIEVFSSVPKNSAINWHKNNIGELHMSCGSPCSSSIYIDFNSQIISDIFPMPLAIDDKNKLILFVNENNKLSVSNIFFSKNIIIERDFSPTASLFTAIKKSKFIGKKSLKLQYLSGDDFDNKTEIIDLNKLGF